MSYLTETPHLTEFVMPVGPAFFTKLYKSTGEIVNSDFTSVDGKIYTFKILQPCECIQDSVTLQTAVLDALPIKQKGFIAKKDEQKFKDMRDGVKGLTVGVFYEGKLIAQSSISLKDLSSIEPYSCHGLRVPSGTKIYECNGTMIHPQNRGASFGAEKMSEKMFSFLVEACAEKFGQTNILLMAEIAADNAINMNSRVNKCGFIARQLYTAEDGVECYLCYKPICRLSLAQPLIEGDVLQVCNLNEISKIKTLLDFGYSITRVAPIMGEDGKKPVGTSLHMGKISQQCLSHAFLASKNETANVFLVH